MNTIDTSYSPSFQANLRIKGLKFKDTKKLEAVKKLFEEKTQHYGTDIFTLKGYRFQGDKGQFLHATDYVLNGENISFSLTHSLKDFFENNSAKDIAKSLVRVFKKGKANEVFNKKLNAINKNIQRTYAGNLLNEEKSHMAAKRGNINLANIYRTLSLSNERRSNTLLAQRKALQAEYDRVSQKITDNPISKIVEWD